MQAASRIANIYLAELDLYMIRKFGALGVDTFLYCRYIDDVLHICDVGDLGEDTYKNS